MQTDFGPKRIIRAAELGLLLVAFVGPWTFDLINVPAEYACSAPFVRLEGDYCGLPMAGFTFLTMLVPAFVGALIDLVTNPLQMVSRARDLIYILLGMSLFLPLISTALMLWKNDSPRRWIFHSLAYVLAVGLGGLWAVRVIRGSMGFELLWGSWLYLLVAAAVFVIEVAGRKFLNSLEPG